MDIVHKIIYYAKLQRRVICKLSVLQKPLSFIRPKNPKSVNINVNMYSWIHVWYLKTELIIDFVINVGKVTFFNPFLHNFYFELPGNMGRKKESKRKWFRFERIIEGEVGE